MSSDSEHPARPGTASRTAGRQMRSRLLDVASARFREHGLGGVSIAALAGEAGAYPSQVTYYFRTKEALFVEAACRDMLYVARDAELAAGEQTTPAGYTRALVCSVMQADALGFFIEAMTLTRRRQDLVPLVARTLERLHVEGGRAHAAALQARGWPAPTDTETVARRFWAITVGIAVEGHALGRSSDEMGDEMLRLLGNWPEGPASATAPTLRLVAANQTLSAGPDEESLP